MAEPYRSWADRRAIISAIIAESNPPPLSSFSLTESEEVFFRARSAKAVDNLAKKTSSFKAYYDLLTARPFGFVLSMSGMVIFAALMAGVYVYKHNRNNPIYPIYAALISLSVLALGWAVTGWMTHRNAVRQHTNNMLFARFSHAPFGDALLRFNRQFGMELEPLVSLGTLQALRATGCEEDAKAASSVGYLLNYYELICSGILRGDLDPSIIRDNIRGIICFYHDKCLPYIREGNRANHRVYENLIKVRTHFREP